MANDSQEFLGELRVGRQLSGIGQVAAGGLVVFLGLLLVLTGGQLETAGQAASAAGLLAAVCLGLTLASILELLGGSGERSGTYILVQETLEGVWGFISGWTIAAGFLVITALFARAAAGLLIRFLPGIPIDLGLLALILLVVLVLIRVFNVLPRGELLWAVVVVVLVGFIVVALTSLPQVDLGRYDAEQAVGPRDFLRAAALLAAGFAGLEMLLASRRQVRQPGRVMPKALVAVLLGGSLVFAAFLLLAAGLPPAEVSSPELTFVGLLADASLAPGWLVGVLAGAVLLLAASGCLMAGVRQMHALSRNGALPRMLRLVRRPFPMPPIVFAAGLVLAAPLVLFAPSEWLAHASACMFLIAILLVNLAAIQSRRTEPERRRDLVVPFFPLIPAVAVAITVALILALPTWGIVAGTVWAVIGAAFYFAYAREHQRVAQKGVLVFGGEAVQKKSEDRCRILVPLRAGTGRRLVLELASALAQQIGGELLLLQVIPVADPLAIEEGRRIAREQNTLFQWSGRMPQRLGVPTFPVTRLARSVSEGILDTAVEDQCDLILLSWPIESSQSGMRKGRVVDPVVRQAPCDVAVVAFHPENLRRLEEAASVEETKGVEETPWRLPIKRIAVPTAGGPHAPLATQLAVLLTRAYEATATAVYVADPQASPKELTEGQERIRQTLTAMKEQAASLPGPHSMGTEGEILVESQVVTAATVVDGIAEVGAASDLVLIGASEESLVDQVLFGNVPEQVAQMCPSPVVVTKRFRGLRRFWLRRVWDALYQSLPKLSRQEQVEVYKQVRRSARPDVDFFVMIGLSAIIATFGLLQDSTAVIIGAMLVAPLFTPILALSVAVVQGDIWLLRLAVESALKGIALAVGLAIVLTAISPLDAVTQEIMARAYPNLFDLMVALASGAAGAYAIARKDVATSLPGVAIAAALVPPLGVIGIGLATGNMVVARGGTLLFITNLIAIVLAGALMLILLGFRPSEGGVRTARLRMGIVVSLILLTIITIPLAAVFVGSARESRDRQAVDNVLVSYIEAEPGLDLVDFDFETLDDRALISAKVYAQAEVSPALGAELEDELERVLGAEVNLDLVVIPVLRLGTESK